MDHQYIEEHHIADRYLMRQLSAEERARFEEHFVDCAECLDRVALAEIFRESLERSAADPPAPPVSDEAEKPGGAMLVPHGPVLEFARVPGSGPLRYKAWQYAALFAVSAILIAGLPTLLLLRQVSQFREQTAAYANSYSAEHQRVAALRRQNSTLDAKLDGQAVPVFNLQEGVPNRVAIPEQAESLLLLPLRGPDASPQLYRAVIRAAGGQVVSEQFYLARGAGFGIVVRSSLLAPGNYSLALEDTEGRKPSSLYSFQIVRVGNAQ
jgi:hypothetical protein